jgi:hypothetical protein
VVERPWLSRDFPEIYKASPLFATQEQVSPLSAHTAVGLSQTPPVPKGRWLPGASAEHGEESMMIRLSESICAADWYLRSFDQWFSGSATAHLCVRVGDRGTGRLGTLVQRVLDRGPSPLGVARANELARASSPWGLDPQCPTLDSLGHSVQSRYRTPALP